MDLNSEALGDEGNEDEGDKTAGDNIDVSAAYPGMGGGVGVLAPVVAELPTTLFTIIVSGVISLLDSILNSNCDGLSLPFRIYLS